MPFDALDPKKDAAALEPIVDKLIAAIDRFTAALEHLLEYQVTISKAPKAP